MKCAKNAVKTCDFLLEKEMLRCECSQVMHAASLVRIQKKRQKCATSEDNGTTAKITCKMHMKRAYTHVVSKASLLTCFFYPLLCSLGIILEVIVKTNLLPRLMFLAEFGGFSSRISLFFAAFLPPDTLKVLPESYSHRATTYALCEDGAFTTMLSECLAYVKVFILMVRKLYFGIILP